MPKTQFEIETKCLVPIHTKNIGVLFLTIEPPNMYIASRETVKQYISDLHDYYEHNTEETIDNLNKKYLSTWDFKDSARTMKEIWEKDLASGFLSDTIRNIYEHDDYLEANQKNESSRDQYVYLMHFEGKYKIGMSGDPEQRRIALSNPIMKVELLMKWEVGSMYAVERKLHSLFKNARIGGEWFHFESKESAIEEVSEAIKSIESRKTTCQ